MLNRKYIFILCFNAFFAVSCGRSAGQTPDYTGQNGANVKGDSTKPGSVDSEDGFSSGRDEDGNNDADNGAGIERRPANNGLGSLNEEARTDNNEETGNFKCKYMRTTGKIAIDGAFPISVPYPFQENFDGKWSDDDSEYTFTMLVGKLIDNKRIPSICYDDPENGQCGGKEAYQVKVLGGPDIGGRFSLHHFDVTVHDADSDGCDVSAKRA